MKLLAPLHLATALAFAVAPFLTAPFSGFREDQLPIPQMDPPIQPAGYAFAIWGVIYLWLVISAGYGFLYRRDDAGWDRARAPLLVSLAIGAAWLWIANTSAIWATVTIWMMLGSALWALAVSPERDAPWLRYPIGLYAGWLSAASFVSLAVLLAGYGIAFDGLTWALIGLPVATAFALTMHRLTLPTLTYGAAVTWALAAIPPDNVASVAILAGCCALLMAAATLLPVLRKTA
ncbi:MAG: hypothetical protein AAF618_11995 [Pseudomonadota bacterium]